MREAEELDLPEDLQLAILSLAAVMPDGTVRTVQDLLNEARAALDLAERTIQENALVEKSLEMVSKRRTGKPRAHLRLNGTVYMTLDKPGAPALSILEEGKLPPLNQLRTEAESLGVPIDDLGRQKKKILERIRKARKAKLAVQEMDGEEDRGSGTLTEV